MPTTRPGTCASGEGALSRGAWSEAREAFEAALREDEQPDFLEGLGMAAWWLDQAETVFETRQRAYRLYMTSGDHASAARVAIWLAWDYTAFRGEHAVANGWLQRARRLLQAHPACSDCAWLEVRAGALCLMEEGDPIRSQTLVAEGIRIAREAGDVDLEMLGRAVQGLALVTAGNVHEGMCCLDEVNAAVIAGELTDLVAIGLSFCYMVTACERVRDCDRAVQWCNRLKSFSAKWGLRPLFAVCRTQYASICVWQGMWSEAEKELRAANDEFVASRPAMASDPLARLAELRRRQGRVAEASALLDQAQSSGLGLLGRAEMAFDRGDFREASEQASRYLRQVHKQNQIDRVPCLELLVRSLTDLGQLENARQALDELTTISTRVATTPLRATARFACGYFAMGESRFDAARKYLEDAVDLFLQSRAPFEAARARVELSWALSKLGRIEPATAELRNAIVSFSELEAEAELVRANLLLEALVTSQSTSNKQGFKPERNAAHPEKTSLLSKREIEVLRLVAEGLNNQSIAQRLFVSEHTIHRHLANILNKLDVPTRAAAVAQASRQGMLI